MRQLLNILEQLNESTGLAGRKPGAKFRNSAGDEITFEEIKFFPERGGKYTQEQLDSALAQIEAGAPDIMWQNERSARTGGIALATFATSRGPLYVGRYLQDIKVSAAANYVPNQVGDYRFAGKAAEKIQSGMTPQDLLVEKVDLTISDIMNQLSKSLGTDHPFYTVAHAIASGRPLPLTFPAPPGLSFSSFRDYFCEILQPMALQMGQFTGNAGEAAETFLGGDFQNTVITFDDSKNAGLSDSIISNSEGKQVKVSTKGGKGAYASSKNLINSVTELQQTPNGAKLLKKYSEVIELLNLIDSAGQAGSPLLLGVKYDIISDQDASTVRTLKNKPLVDLNTLGEMNLSPALKKLALSRKTDKPEQTDLYYHLIAAIAFKAADAVNNNTNFSSAAADILNNSALVQMYTKAKEGKDTWTLEEFDTVYPGKSIKGVYLTASKTYYSTNIKGNFTFKIDKGEGKTKDEEQNEPSVPSYVDTESDFVDAAAAIARPKRTSINKSEPGTTGLGREKRKR